jgi:hypothetical protein
VRRLALIAARGTKLQLDWELRATHSKIHTMPDHVLGRPSTRYGDSRPTFNVEIAAAQEASTQ